MGADGHILLIDKTKAVAKFGRTKWQEIRDHAPSCSYERSLENTEIVTFYFGDNMIDSLWSAEDWYDGNVELAKEFLAAIPDIEIDTWEVWT